MGTISIGTNITKSLMAYFGCFSFIIFFSGDCLSSIRYVPTNDVNWFNGFKELLHIATCDLFSFFV